MQCSIAVLTAWSLLSGNFIGLGLGLGDGVGPVVDFHIGLGRVLGIGLGTVILHLIALVIGLGAGIVADLEHGGGVGGLVSLILHQIALVIDFEHGLVGGGLVSLFLHLTPLVIDLCTGIVIHIKFDLVLGNGRDESSTPSEGLALPTPYQARNRRGGLAKVSITLESHQYIPSTHYRPDPKHILQSTEVNESRQSSNLLSDLQS